MSYFNACEDCGKEFEKRSYDYSVCKDCIIKNHLHCEGCNIVIDENQFYHRGGICFKCEENQEQEAIKKIQVFNTKSDSDLESMWQAQCMTIKMALDQYYKTSDEKFREMAEEAQDKQSIIQDEITRRH